MIWTEFAQIVRKANFFCIAEGKTLWAAKRELWLLSKLNYLQGSLEKLRVDNTVQTLLPDPGRAGGGSIWNGKAHALRACAFLAEKLPGLYKNFRGNYRK